MYKTIGDGSFNQVEEVSTNDMFYRESTEKKAQLEMMERNPSHKF